MTKIIVQLIIFLALIGCQRSSIRETSLDRVEKIASFMFEGEINGSFAKSGKHEKAGVIFNIRNIPLKLKILLDKSRESPSSVITQERISAKWISATESWNISWDESDKSYSLKIQENLNLLTVVIVEQ